MPKTIVAMLIALLSGPATDVPQSGRTALATGTWGGTGIEMTVTATGATIDYGCDSGTVDEPLQIDRAGRLTARGTHSFGRGGPRREGDPPPKPRVATYDGTADGRTLRLTVVLPELSRTIGEFTLGYGERAVLDRCL